MERGSLLPQPMPSSSHGRFTPNPRLLVIIYSDGRQAVMNYTLTVPEKIIRKINEDIPEEDYESFLLQCLDIGLNAVNQASLGIDFAMVEKGFESFSSEVERRIIGDNSELARSIREHFTKADSPFRTALDPTNKAGPVGRFIHEQQESQQAAHDSYAEVQAELVEKINEEFNQIKQAMDYEGIMKRKAEELDAKDKVGTAKGTDFEMEVLDFLSEKVKPNDALSATGTKSGEGTRRKVGDLGVTVNPDAVAPFDITLEVKSGKFTMRGQTSLLQQLNDAMEIRNAKAGIAVADRAYAGAKHTDSVRRVGKNRYVVLVDRDSQDFGPVETMYWALREAIILEETQDKGAISKDEIEDLVQGISNEISILQSMKRNLSDSSDNIMAEHARLSKMEKNIKWRLKDLLSLGNKDTIHPDEIETMNDSGDADESSAMFNKGA